MPTQDSPLSLDKVKTDVASAVHDGHGFSQVFKEIQDSIAGQQGPQQKAALDAYKSEINKDLPQGFPKIDLSLDDKGHLHVQDAAKHVDVDVNSSKLDAVKSADPPRSGEKAPTVGEAPKGETVPKTAEVKAGETGPKATEKTSAADDYWKQHEAKETATGTDIKVKPGDSLWNIAEHDLEKRFGRKLDQKNLKDMAAVNKRMKEIAAEKQDPPIKIENHRAMIKEHQKVHIPKDSKVTDPQAKGDGDAKKEDPNAKKEDPNAKKEDPNAKKEDPNAKKEDPGTSTSDAQGNKTTTYGDGTVKHENSDGTGDVTHKDGSSHHWGPHAEQNYDTTADGSRVTKGQGGESVSKHKDGSQTTTYPDGSVKEESADGKTGYVRSADKSEHHWGPKKEDNYDVTTDGGKQTQDEAGRTVTKWNDGTERTEDQWGRGVVKKPDGSEHHYGPNQGDNYDKNADGTTSRPTADGGVQTTFPSDGSKVTKYPDGSMREEKADGSGYAKHADGSEEHWGKHKEDNWKRTADGGHQTADSQGNTTTVYPDGSVRYENKDGTGSSWQHNKDGGYKVHRWGPKPEDNPPDEDVKEKAPAA